MMQCELLILISVTFSHDSQIVIGFVNMIYNTLTVSTAEGLRPHPNKKFKECPRYDIKLHLMVRLQL